MLPRRGLFLVTMMFVLTLSGCFRQASDNFESVPANDQGVQPLPTTVEPSPTSDNGITLATATPIILEPASETPAIGEVIPTDIPVIEPTNTEIISVNPATNTSPPTLDTGNQNVQPSPTDAPFINPTNTPQPQVEITQATATTGFITPRGVQGPIGTEPPTPTGTSLNGTPLQATPTGIFVPTDDCLYVVQPGDNLYRISVSNGITLAELRAANPEVTGDLIQPGDELILPIEGCTADGGTSTLPDTTTDTTDTTLPEGIQAIHIVQAGETLNIIARQYGVTINAIAQANGITDVNRISINQELLIPVAPATNP